MLEVISERINTWDPAVWTDSYCTQDKNWLRPKDGGVSSFSDTCSPLQPHSYPCHSMTCLFWTSAHRPGCLCLLLPNSSPICLVASFRPSRVIGKVASFRKRYPESVKCVSSTRHWAKPCAWMTSFKLRSPEWVRSKHVLDDFASLHAPVLLFRTGMRATVSTLQFLQDLEPTSLTGSSEHLSLCAHCTYGQQVVHGYKCHGECNHFFRPESKVQSISSHLGPGWEYSQIPASASVYYVVNSFSLMVAFKAWFNLAIPIIRSVLN